MLKINGYFNCGDRQRANSGRTITVAMTIAVD